jgi:uncharacterized membrane protein YraQ (UPF0718 family)
MDTTTLILGIIAVGLLVAAFFIRRGLPQEGLLLAGKTLWRNALMLLFGFIIAGMVQVMVPQEWITRFLGSESGLKGLLTGCVIGGLMPGAPYAVFPLLGGLYKAGAAVGPIVSFSVAWSLWSVTRLPIEMALVDPKVALIRFASTFLVPPLAGMLATVISKLV